jgi:hypothetical protein
MAMKQHKYYIFSLGVLFAVQIFFVTVFMLTMDGSGLQKKHIEILEAQNNSLMNQVAGSSLTQSRQVASIDTTVQYTQVKKNVKELDLSEHYFAQIEQFKKENNRMAALETIAKIQETSSNAEYIAKAEYEKINLICTQKLEVDCINEIDMIVSQFPDSNWTAKSLLLLSHYYYKENRVNDSKTLINIIRTEFKTYNELDRDIKKLSVKTL